MDIFKPYDDSELKKALEQTQNRLDRVYEGYGQATELRSRMDALERLFETERLALTELYDKAYHMLQRHAKRVRDAAPAEEETTPQPTLDLVTDRVLQRRNGTHGVSPVTPR